MSACGSVRGHVVCAYVEQECARGLLVCVCVCVCRWFVGSCVSAAAAYRNMHQLDDRKYTERQ